MELTLTTLTFTKEEGVVSGMYMAHLCAMENILQFIGTGEPSAFSLPKLVQLYSLFRYLQQWVIVWNDYPGNIWITTAKTLPNFERPSILIVKENDDQKNWYPNIIHKTLGNEIKLLMCFIFIYLICRRQTWGQHPSLVLERLQKWNIQWKCL